MTTSEEARPYIGGQAVLEGVMMRAPNGVSVAVRRPDGTIAVRESEAPTPRSALFKLPGFRGVYSLYESMKLGYSALQFSASQAFDEPASTPDPAATQGEVVKVPATATTESGGGLGSLLPVTVALALFIALPQGLTSGLSRLLGLGLDVRDVGFHVITALFKLTVFTGYILFVRRIPEMRRVFQYHGAEHKTIYTYEAGLPLDVENVRTRSTLHPRCGTTFLITVAIFGAILGALVTPFVVGHASGMVAWAETLVLRIAMLPIVAAVGFEFQRFSARYCTTGPLRFVNYPGFLFQKLTTIEPDDAQIEVAIAAMESAIARNAKVTEDDVVRVFPSLEEVHAHYAIAG